jgi:hypothetical protein
MEMYSEDFESTWTPSKIVGILLTLVGVGRTLHAQLYSQQAWLSFHVST